MTAAFCFCGFSEERKNDYAYFERVNAAIADLTAISAFVHKLNTADLSGFNVRRRPQTTEHLEQKLHSLEGFDRFWFKILHSGSLMPTPTTMPEDTWDAACFIASARLTSEYKAFGSSGHQPTFTERDLGDIH